MGQGAGDFRTALNSVSQARQSVQRLRQRCLVSPHNGDGDAAEASALVSHADTSAGLVRISPVADATDDLRLRDFNHPHD